MKFSIIVPHFNNLSLLINCITSIRSHTSDFQLVIVDDGSTDGSVDWIKSQCQLYKNTIAIFIDKNSGFPSAVNAGLGEASGENIIILNNDVLVTPGWADSMLSSIPVAEKLLNLNNIGMVGPVSNYAGGSQAIPFDQYSLDQLDSNATQHRQNNKDHILFTGFLSFFCVLITRKCLNNIGPLNESFSPGLWEDNEFCLRAQLKGFQLIIDQSTFVHHFGSSTFMLDSAKYNQTFHANHMKLLSQFYDDSPEKLIGVCRVKNQKSFLFNALSRASDFCDEIIVLCDNCTDNSAEIARTFKKVSYVIESDSPFNEARDRSLLMRTALNRGADWCFSFDADELIEESFTRKVAEKLMHPVDPQILGYGFNFRTFFLGETHYRTDGVFGSMWGVRMWKISPNSYSQSSGHYGLHCTHCSPIPRFNVRRLRYRIKHYGYSTPEMCNEKLSFYSKKDPTPSLRQTSPIGYRHITQEGFSLMEYKEKNSLSLAMIVKNEVPNIFSFLIDCYFMFDEIIIVDTGSNDDTKKVASLFTDKIYDFKWNGNFGSARNFVKSKCSGDWIMQMDPDEKIPAQNISTIYEMLEGGVDCWLFKFENYQKDGSIIFSDNIRLFKNIDGLEWGWFCHENMSKSIDKFKLSVVEAPFNLQHFGFLKDDTVRNHKIKQYGSMLRTQIKKFPKEPIGYFHYAFHLFEDGNENAGMDYLKKAVKLKPEFFLAHKELALRLLAKSLVHIKFAAKHTPEQHYYKKWLMTLDKEITDLISRPLE